MVVVTHGASVVHVAAMVVALALVAPTTVHRGRLRVVDRAGIHIARYRLRIYGPGLHIHGAGVRIDRSRLNIDARGS